ncbi:MAG: hypothetical protein HUJ75_00950, partial [Parasporobacterium sp.]|nr:hypothetical protein [Parasporobacterium sp.]
SLGTIEDSNATFANGSYKGNIWNNIYNYTEALNVTLDNASLEGQVSASYGYHSDDEGNRLENGTVLKSCTAPNYLDPVTGSNGDYLKIGAFINVPNKVVNNPINLTITNGSKWTVTGEANYLAALTVDALENIESASKTTVYAQALTVGGEAKADGTYENGNVTIIVEAAPVVDLNTDTLATTQDYSGLHAVTFKAVDAAGNPMSKGVAFSYKAFTTIDFTAKAKSGYKVESVTCSDEAALKDNGDGSYTLENLKEAANTVTIVVAESDEPEQGGMMPGGPMPGGDGQMPGGDGQMPGGDGQMPEGTPPEGTPPDGFGGGTQGPPPDAQ